MTRAVQDRILKDVNGNISDHLRNHIHLTNCIHLKNHMHKQSPILADRALMRDLVVLQRSKSLRDPSASPSWHASSAVDAFHQRGDEFVNPRRSIGIEQSTEIGRLLGGSPPVAFLQKVEESTGQNNLAAATAGSNRSIKEMILEPRRAKQEKLNRKSVDMDAMAWHDDRPQHGNDVISDSVSGNSQSRNHSVKKKSGNGQNRHLRTLSDKLNNVRGESDNVASSQNIDIPRHSQAENIADKVEAGIHSHVNSLNRERRRRFRSSRRNRSSIAAQEADSQNEMSVASNSFAQCKAPAQYNLEEGVKEIEDQHVSGVPRNGCGIPWNWSSIHNRGKTFLDIAGRSLSCGLSDPRLKKGDSFPHQRNIHDVPVMSGHESSSSKSAGEALPLLLEASVSQGSVDHVAWRHDYSGELGIFADNLLKGEIDSDLDSEGRSLEQHTIRRQHNDMHQNITEKYMPRTFKDLVGQNLVVQALSNAISKRKVGLLYVFYGPHGTGKTSCARTFARALNCLSSEHNKPCGFCNSCIAHDMGKNRSIREIGPVSSIDVDEIVEVLDGMIASHLQSQYRVFIFDECDTLSSDCWSAILKVIDRSPRRVVFILVCSSLDVLPRIIISRCQKFFFPKLKDADIIYTLQWIASKEEVEIDKDALKLIASRSDGSLRDAEMTLEQLSLLGQRISLCLVQELVGLISDEKLIDLLDLAFSADTVNTVKNLRDIMESGAEPLALMSQLATVITDILAGNSDFLKGRPKRKFFRRQTLSKEDMEKLRQALKTLSEAEKQLRVSNDRMTWLTAALLQLAPDQQYMLPSSSADTSTNHSPLPLNNDFLKEESRKSNVEMSTGQARSSGDVYHNTKSRGVSTAGKGQVGDGVFFQQLNDISRDKKKTNKVQLQVKYCQELKDIWLEVIEKIPTNSIKEFLYREGKLISLSYGPAPTVQLLFNTQPARSTAERFRAHILQAFESVLKSPVTIEIKYGSGNDIAAVPLLSQGSQSQPHFDANPIRFSSSGVPFTNHGVVRRVQDSGVGTSEIVEIEASSGEHEGIRINDDKQNSENILAGATSQRESTSLSLVRSRLSLAHVIQHTESCSQQSGWSKRKAVSIAEKLEQENLRLEPRSRRLICWNPPRVSGRKLSRLRFRSRKPCTILKFISCGRCLSGRSPR